MEEDFVSASRRERHCMHNSLVALVQAILHRYITIELKCGSSVCGKLTHVDGFMNVNLTEAVLLTADDTQHLYEFFFVQARKIKFFTIPGDLLKKKRNGEETNCLYIGDNVIQDIVTPSQHNKCHTLAVSEELWAEDVNHPDKLALSSSVWGSYFGNSKLPSMWYSFLTKNSHIIVPNFDVVTKLPLSGPIPVGFYPKPPSGFID